MRQYYPSWVELPEVGKVIELANKSGEVEKIGVVTGVYKKSRIAIIKELDIDIAELEKANA